MEIKEYKNYKESEIHRLYTEVGWTAYTENMSLLEQGYKIPYSFWLHMKTMNCLESLELLEMVLLLYSFKTF